MINTTEEKKAAAEYKITRPIKKTNISSTKPMKCIDRHGRSHDIWIYYVVCYERRELGERVEHKGNVKFVFEVNPYRGCTEICLEIENNITIDVDKEEAGVRFNFFITDSKKEENKSPLGLLDYEGELICTSRCRKNKSGIIYDKTFTGSLIF